MPGPAALDPAITAHRQSATNLRWWQTDQAFAAHDAACGRLKAAELARFRFGDASLEVAVDDTSILNSIRKYYGECELGVLEQGRPPLIRCTVSAGCVPPLIAIHILQAPELDLATIALGLSHPLRGVGPHAISGAPRRGWSLIGGSGNSIAAACRTGLLIDSAGVADDFLADYLAAAALCAQDNLLVLHAAAVQIGTGGALLTGASHAGKTTTSLQLALRGHRLLGDEMAVVRLGTRELLPMRKSLSVRAGPRSPALAAALRRVRPKTAQGANGEIGPLQIGDLCPVTGNHPVRLTTAFFLTGFSARPRVQPFELSLNDETTFDYMSANDVASISWGLDPQRRTLRLLALKQIMRHVRCWQLQVGSPDATAKLIEDTMEER